MTTTNVIRVCAALMLKNERDAIVRTLDSLNDKVDGFVVYDTGSTDDTLDLIRKYFESEPHRVDIKIGEFVDYGPSRNTLLDFADETAKYDFAILIDANDEFIGCRPHEELSTEYDGYFVRRKLLYDVKGYILAFNALKVIRCGSGIRSKGVAHEYEDATGKRVCERVVESFYIYQDRTTENRERNVRKWEKDRDLLERQLQSDPDNSRALFYLAQSYFSLGDYEKAYNAYVDRIKCKNAGFVEEIWRSMLECGKILKSLNVDWRYPLEWFMSCYEMDNRVEPLVEIISHYNAKQNYDFAYAFARLACQLDFPARAQLFVEESHYTYTRWHLAGICAYYYAKKHKCDEAMRFGKSACEKAVATGIDAELNEKNLAFYSSIV